MKPDRQMECKVLKTEEYLRVLMDEKMLTFATIVDGIETHHQISILEYNTRDLIEKKMAETMIQVAEELERNGNSQRKAPIPADIQALVDENPIMTDPETVLSDIASRDLTPKPVQPDAIQ